MRTVTDKKSKKNVESLIALAILEESQKNIEDFNAIDTSELYLSGRIEGGKIIFDAPHASWIEYGTDPHPVSEEGVQNIARWCRRKLGLKEKEAQKAARAIAWKIRREGTEPRPYFRNAVDKILGKRIKLGRAILRY